MMKGECSKLPVVVIFVDPVFDFLHEEGAFARAVGTDRTITVRSVLPTLLRLAEWGCEHGDFVKLVHVSSFYRPRQFRACSDLCTTATGRQWMLPSNMPFALEITKTSNSLLDVVVKRHEAELLELVSHSQVPVCGVTLLHCIRQAVETLQCRCANVFVTRDTVSS